jgi:biopolymer transport protein ExbB
MPWFNSSYLWKQQITINHSQVSGGASLTNFPVLLSFTDVNLKTVANGGKVQNSNGYDIIFTDSTETTQLYHEIETYTASTGAIVFWVKIPTLSYTADTTIYMYFDNASISTFQSTATSVWDSNYGGVWHLADNATNTTVKDSTSNANNGTAAANTSTKHVTGEIGGALSFNGTSDKVALGSTGIPTGNSSYTLSAWFKPNADGVYGIIGWGTWGTTNAVNAFRTDTGPPSLLNYWWGNDLEPASTASLANAWHYGVAKFDGTTRAVWLDGVQVATDTPGGAHNATASDINIGRTNSTEWFNGNLDEIRVSNVARSDGWIVTTYNNQSTPGSFLTVGSAIQYAVSKDITTRGRISIQQFRDIVLRGIVGPHTLKDILIRGVVGVPFVSIGSVGVTIDESSFKWMPKLDERWRCQFTVLDYTGTQFFKFAEQVVVTDRVLGILFTGVIVDVKQDKKNTYPDKTIEHQID